MFGATTGRELLGNDLPLEWAFTNEAHFDELMSLQGARYLIEKASADARFANMHDGIKRMPNRTQMAAVFAR